MDFRVAKGRALTTARGMRSEGDIIRPSDLTGDGTGRLLALENLGFVERVTEPTAAAAEAPAMVAENSPEALEPDTCLQPIQPEIQGLGPIDPIPAPAAPVKPQFKKRAGAVRRKK